MWLQQMLHQVEQRRLGPVDVLEYQDQRPAARERLEQLRHRPREVLARAVHLFEPRGLQHALRDQRGARALGQRRHQGRMQIAPAGKLAHDLAERPVGDPLAVGQAAAGQHGCPVAQGAVQLAGQPGLADAGRAEHDHALRRALVGDALEGLAQGAQLRVAALQRRAGRGALVGGRPAQAPHRERLGLAAHRQRRQRLRRDGAGDQAPGGVADQRLSRGRRLLKPRGDVHGVTGHQRLARGRVPCDHVAAVDAGPDRDLDSPLALQVIVHAGQLLLELLGRADRPQRMVLERDGCPEDGHRRVADELLDRAAVAGDHAGDGVEVAQHHLPHRLRLEPLGQGRRPCDVREEDGYRLALVATRSAKTGATRIAKNCVRRIRLAASSTAPHGMPV